MQGVDLLGFAGDCTITAKVTMFGDRLTDFLNGQERFHIHKVIFESLDDGHLVAEDSVSITRTPRSVSAPAAVAASNRVWQCFGWPRHSGPGTPGRKMLSGRAWASAATGSRPSSKVAWRATWCPPAPSRRS